LIRFLLVAHLSKSNLTAGIDLKQFVVRVISNAKRRYNNHVGVEKSFGSLSVASKMSLGVIEFAKRRSLARFTFAMKNVVLLQQRMIKSICALRFAISHFPVATIGANYFAILAFVKSARLFQMNRCYVFVAKPQKLLQIVVGPRGQNVRRHVIRYCHVGIAVCPFAMTATVLPASSL